MAYLGFQKEGPNFCWPLVLTQRGAKPYFQIFSYGENFFFRPKGYCHGPMASPKYTNGSTIPRVGGGYSSKFSNIEVSLKTVLYCSWEA